MNGTGRGAVWVCGGGRGLWKRMRRGRKEGEEEGEEEDEKGKRNKL